MLNHVEVYLKARDLSERVTTRSHGLFVLLIAILFVIALSYPPLPVMTLVLDTEQYRETSKFLLSGKIFVSSQDTDPVPQIHSVRPPLYPGLLALANLLPSGSGIPSIVLVHLGIGFLILTIIPISLRAVLPMTFTSIALGIGMYAGKQLVWADMSEWLAMCCILSAIGSYLQFAYYQRPRYALYMMAFASCAILTRTALIHFLLLSVFSILLAHRGSRIKVSFFCLAGLTPLVIWTSIKLFGTGLPPGGAYEMSNLIASARTFSQIPLHSKDDPDLVRFITLLNERGVSSDLESLNPSDIHKWDGPFYDLFHKNFTVVDQLLKEFGSTAKLSPIDLFIRGVTSNWEGYCSFLRGGLHTFLDSCLPLIGLCVVINIWLYRRSVEARPFCFVAITLALISLVYLGAIFTVMLWLPRYMAPIQSPLLFCCLVSGYLLFRSYKSRRVAS